MAQVTSIEDLGGLVKRALEQRRPILHHHITMSCYYWSIPGPSSQPSDAPHAHYMHQLTSVVNADTSWLIQLPVPTSPTSANSSRAWYNIILDPWLSGPQSDLASWFSQQWHAIAPAIKSMDEVEELCHRIEILSRPDITPSGPFVDAIAISHEFTDHCHKPTLVQAHHSTPVFATTKAAALIQKWKHFDTVIDTQAFTMDDPDWRNTASAPLPPWIGISKLVNNKDALYYHSAILISFDLDHDKPTSGEDEAKSLNECIVYTPHGIHPPSLEPITKSSPPLQTLGFLHGLHDVSIDWGQQLNLGAHNGLKAQKMLQARYWVGTHDEVKKGGGIVSWFLRRKPYTVKDALEQQLKQSGEKENEGNEVNVLGRGEFLDLQNGQSAILE